MFSSSVSESSPNNTCGGYYAENAYVLRVSCNTCGSVTMQEELNANKEYCNALCKVATLSCMTPLNSWGSVLSGEATACGNDDASLPGCSESSSSESVESSSSKASSSSQEQKSSGEESSSSGGDDGESSSSEGPESSSSEDDESSSSFEESSSSEKSSSSSMNGRYDLVYGYEGFCNKSEHFLGAYGFMFDSYGTGKHYTRKPGIVGPKKFRFSCFDNAMEIATNIPQVYTNWVQIQCYNSETEERRDLDFPDIPVAFTCPDVEKSTIEGCPTEESFLSNGAERVINLYVYLYDIHYTSSISDVRIETEADAFYWKEFFDDIFGYDFDSSYFDRFPSNYSKMDLLNEPELVSFFNECKRTEKTENDFYSMIKEKDDSVDVRNVFHSWMDLSDEYYQSLGISSYEDYCRFHRGENAVLYQSDPLIREEYYNEESSNISKIYDVLYYCAPPKSSSSSAEVSSSSESSSSLEFSSSSEKSSSSEESSSSEPPSSSSLSSSSEESSSSSEEIVVESSSVMPVDEPFVAGPDQVYTPDQIFSSGLQNMEPGACYSLNPDRGTIYGWNISYNASDSWWWRKVDCETGEKPVEKGIGICAAFPGSKPDKVSACYAHNGSCYVCDNSKDYIDCNADWLWNYNFPTHSWFKQVDCYDPFGEEDEIIAGGCLDESLLRKVSMREYAEDDESLNYSVDFMKPVKKYDALGRHGTNKQPSHMALYQKNMGIPQQQIETFVILQIPSISSVDYCNRDSSGSWNCNKNKKGLKKRVMSVDEFVDSKRCDIKKGREYWYFIKNTDPETGEEVKTYVGGVTCAWPNVTINHEPISQKNELIYSNGKIVGAKATVKYRFYTHTTLGENNHIIMKAGDVFSDGHVVTSADETCYEKHEQGHEKYNECVSYEEVEETGTFECTVKVSGTMSKEKRTEILNDAVTADLTVKRDLFENQHLQDRLNKAQKKLDKSRDLFHADYGLDGYAGKNDKLPKSYRCPNF